MFYDCNSIVAGVKLAADMKTNSVPQSMKDVKFNVGATYASPAGLTAFCFNNRGLLTIGHHLKVDKQLAFAVEVVQPVSSKAEIAKNPLTVGVSYKPDRDHEIKARLNKGGDMSVALTKSFTPTFDCVLASTMSMKNPESLMSIPSFGFKIVTK